ncbi:hypothetical protein RMATCC62417_11389 [Rhizopus microsporus]|nr:hypothetical protein RMATCC62417_11389 [Rhizopus microsporus]
MDGRSYSKVSSSSYPQVNKRRLHLPLEKLSKLVFSRESQERPNGVRSQPGVNILGINSELLITASQRGEINASLSFPNYS